MKKFLSICLIAIMSLTVSLVAAQQPSKKVVIETTQFSVKIDTPATESKIVKSISKVKGVVDLKVDAKKDMVTVAYDKALLNNVKLTKEFEKINVRAKVVPQPNKK